MNPDEYCRNKAARAGSSLYYSLLFAPEDKRDAVTALCAYCREVEEVADECHEIGVARVKLQWWRDEVQRMFDGHPNHPVTRALTAHARTYDLPREHFLEIIDGVEMDVAHFSYPTFKELSLYCHRVASMAGLMAAEILGSQDRRTLKFAHRLGTALRLTRIIRNVARDGARGRVYLPLEELAQYRVSAEAVMAGRGGDHAAELIKHQVQRAYDYYREALDHLPEVDRYPQRSALVMAALNQAALKEIEAAGYRVWDRRIMLTPVRKLWISWRVARREERRMKRARRVADITHA